MKRTALRSVMPAEERKETFSAFMRTWPQQLQQGILPPETEEELERLSNSIQKILDAKVVQRKSNERTWLRQIEDVASDIDDFLHLTSSEGGRHKIPSALRSKNSKMGNFRNHSAKQKIAVQDLKTVRMNLDKILKKLFIPSLQLITEHDRDIKKMSIIHSPVETLTVSMGNEDQEKIIDLLLSVKLTDQVGPYIIPITRKNCGGAPTTKLAQAICDDKRVVNHFRERIWVNASLIIDLGKLSKLANKPASTLFWISKSLNCDLEEEQLLIVFDYIRKESTDHQVRWLKVDKYQSKNKLVSTALPSRYWGKPKRDHVFDTINWAERYSPHESWMAFKECVTVCARGCKDHYMNLQLEDIGRNIVEKLGGSPSMIRTIGYILSQTREPSVWKFVLESEIWKLPVKELVLYKLIKLCCHCGPMKYWPQECNCYLNEPSCLKFGYLWPEEMQHNYNLRNQIVKNKLPSCCQAHESYSGGRRSRCFTENSQETSKARSDR